MLLEIQVTEFRRLRHSVAVAQLVSVAFNVKRYGSQKTY